MQTHLTSPSGPDGHRQSRALARMEADAEKPHKFALPLALGLKKFSASLGIPLDKAESEVVYEFPRNNNNNNNNGGGAALPPIVSPTNETNTSLFRRTRVRKESKESNEARDARDIRDRRTPPQTSDDGDRHSRKASFGLESPVSFAPRGRERRDSHGILPPTSPVKDPERRKRRSRRASHAQNELMSPRTAAEATPTTQSTSTLAVGEDAASLRSPEKAAEMRPPLTPPQDTVMIPEEPLPIPEEPPVDVPDHDEQPLQALSPPPPPPPPPMPAAQEPKEPRDPKQASSPRKPKRAPSPLFEDPGRVVSLEAALEGAQRNEAELAQRLANAHDEMARYGQLLQERDAYIAEQETLLAQERARVDQLRVRLQEQVERAAGLAGTSLIAHSGLVTGTQLPGSELVQRWKLLHWQIQQCVESRMPADDEPTPAVWLDVPPRRAPLLRQLTPAYARFMAASETEGGRRRPAYLAMAAVWSFLAANVFGGQNQASPMLWAGQMAEPLGRIALSMLRRRSRDPAFHLWRAQTAGFVRSLFGEGGGGGGGGLTTSESPAAAASYGEAATQQLALDVGYFLEPDSPAAGRGVSDGLWRQLAIIVDTATALDADLSQQRAWYYVHYPTAAATGQRHGMAFDVGTMEDVVRGEEDDSAVQLIVRPALVKAGNGDGEGYDQAVVVEPSLVCRAEAVEGGQGQEA